MAPRFSGRGTSDFCGFLRNRFAFDGEVWDACCCCCCEDPDAPTSCDDGVVKSITSSLGASLRLPMTVQEITGTYANERVSRSYSIYIRQSPDSATYRGLSRDIRPSSPSRSPALSFESRVLSCCAVSPQRSKLPKYFRIVTGKIRRWHRTISRRRPQLHCAAGRT